MENNKNIDWLSHLGSGIDDKLSFILKKMWDGHKKEWTRTVKGTNRTLTTMERFKRDGVNTIKISNGVFDTRQDQKNYETFKNEYDQEIKENVWIIKDSSKFERRQLFGKLEQWDPLWSNYITAIDSPNNSIYKSEYLTPIAEIDDKLCLRILDLMTMTKDEREFQGSFEDLGGEEAGKTYYPEAGRFLDYYLEVIGLESYMLLDWWLHGHQEHILYVPIDEKFIKYTEELKDQWNDILSPTLHLTGAKGGKTFNGFIKRISTILQLDCFKGLEYKDRDSQNKIPGKLDIRKPLFQEYNKNHPDFPKTISERWDYIDNNLNHMIREGLWKPLTDLEKNYLFISDKVIKIRKNSNFVSSSLKNIIQKFYDTHLSNRDPYGEWKYIEGGSIIRNDGDIKPTREKLEMMTRFQSK